ncbi:MAG: haloacid dehalogenase [Chloroflexota bacterium]|nr:MAG: haloacid dehalogenase [Chloroflexota bacterium]
MQTHDSFTVVLFDIDGTLLRSDGAGRAATRAAMLEVFGAADGVETLNFGGKTDWFIITELLADQGHTHADIARLMPVYGAALARHLERALTRYRIWALPGALDAVTALRARPNTLIGLITGNVRDTVAFKLRAAGYEPDWFTVGAYGSESPDRSEVAALAVARAAQAAGRSLHPAQTVIVGDTPADVACARAVGARAVAVVTGFASREELAAAGPDHLLDDLSALPGVL